MAGNTTAWKLIVDAIVNAKDLDELKTKVAGVTGELGKAEKQTSLTSKAIGFLSGAGASAAIGALGGVVKMAREEEVGMTRLGTAVDNAGTSWAAHKGAIEAVIGARQRLAFSDGELRDSLTVLTTATGNVNKALDLQKLAMDVSRARNISLADASMLVAKAAEGQAGPLKKAGIAVRDNATAVELLATLQQKSAGASEAYAATSQGAADRVKNSWDNALENVGGFVDEHLGVLASATTIYSNFGGGVHVAAGALGAFVKSGGNVKGVLAGITGGIRVLGVALRGLFLNPIGLAVLAIGALVIGLKLLYDRSEKVRQIVGVVGDALKKVFGPILAGAGAVLGFIGDRLGDVGKFLGIVGDEANENLAGDLPRAAAEGERAVGGLQGALEYLSGFMKGQRGGAGDATEELLTKLGMDKATVNSALDALDDTLGAGMVDRATKWFDTWYATNQPQAKDRIYAEAEAMAKVVKEGGTALTQAAGEAGLSVTDYIAKANQKMAEADHRMDVWTGDMVEAKKKLSELTEQELKSLQRKDAELVAIHQTRDAWNEARLAADAYNRTTWNGSGPMAPSSGGGGGGDVLTAADGAFISATQRVLVHAGERILSPAATRAYDSGHGAITIAPVFNYSGPADRAAAARMVDDVLDPVTEAVRQQLRRLAIS